MSAVVFKTDPAQFLLIQAATGNALADGFAAAHFNSHAVSLQGQAKAHACPVAHLASSKQVAMESAHLSREHAHWSGQAAVLQSMSAVVFKTDPAQFLLIQAATGNALADGFAAAHFNSHAVSLQGQANAHACPVAHLASSKHVAMESAHLSREHAHWSGQAAVLQSMSAVVFKTDPAQFLLIQAATGNALADGFAAAHFNSHAVSLQGQAKAHACPVAHLASSKQVAMESAHLSREHAHWSGQAAVLQSMSAVVFKTDPAQFLLIQAATGNALADGFAAAHFNSHAVSLQGQANAHACPVAHLASSRHVAMESAHLSREHAHWSGQAAVLQSMSTAPDTIAKVAAKVGKIMLEDDLVHKLL